MLATRIIGWISFFFIVGFLIYGFRQGFRAKAEAKKILRRRPVIPAAIPAATAPVHPELSPRRPAAAAGACQ